MNEHKTGSVRQRAGMKSSIVMYPYVKTQIAELKDEWGFKTTSETIAVAVLYLAQATRKGISRIEFDEPKQ